MDTQAALSPHGLLVSTLLGASGDLSPESFRSMGEELFDGHGWQAALCRLTGWCPSTVNRYLTGKLPIPRHVTVLMEALSCLAVLSDPLADNLPVVRNLGIRMALAEDPKMRFIPKEHRAVALEIVKDLQNPV